MPIRTNLSPDSLVNNEITNELKRENSNQDPKNDSKLDLDSVFNPNSTKKSGFLKSTTKELIKTEWPSLSYVLKWSSVIIMFTTIFALSVGLIDNIFDATVKYTTCLAPLETGGKGQDGNNCRDNLVKNLTFKNDK
jgi:preprotein translocase SecE subunit